MEARRKYTKNPSWDENINKLTGVSWDGRQYVVSETGCATFEELRSKGDGRDLISKHRLVAEVTKYEEGPMAWLTPRDK